MKSYKVFYKRNLPHYQPPGYTFFVTYRLHGSLPIEIIKQLKQKNLESLKIISGYTDESRKFEEYRKYQSDYFGKFDKLLDGFDYGPTWLKEDKIAQIVKEAIHFYDKKSYELICHTIMYNHVHQVFTPIVNKTVSRISDSTKSGEINKEVTRNRVSNYNKFNQISDAIPNDLDDEENIQSRVSGYLVTKILQDLKRYTSVKCNKILNRSGAFWQHESYDHVVRDYDELLRIVKYVLNNPVKARLCNRWEDWKWSYCNNDYL